jgi:membrane-associated phospholipid phosphatase
MWCQSVGFLPIYITVYVLFKGDYHVILGLMITTLTVVVIKHITNMFPENSKMFQLTRRPRNASCCGILGGNKNESKEAGFPSGHAAFISYFLSSLPQESAMNNIVSICLYLITIHNRMETNCHDLLQIISGTMVGLFVGLFV